MRDELIDVAEGLKATARVWRNRKILWSEFSDRLRKPVVTNETYKQFMSSSKTEQMAIKDQGGFFGGYLTNGSRKKENIRCRRLLCLDLDFSVPDAFDRIRSKWDVEFVLHTTHKSCPDNPRHRLIIPLSRDVSADEYEPIARKVASEVGMELFDPSTYEVNRIMFYPSVSKDGAYECLVNDGEWLDADKVLGMYKDWRDAASWDTTGWSDTVLREELKRAEDPTEKAGIIGAFCRTYSITEAIDKFLPDVYEECGENRYTYKEGTTQGGLVCYEDKFAYSHHGTDPSGGRLCNAFDLVRVHKFGALDSSDSIKASMAAMERFVLRDEGTIAAIAEEKRSAVEAAFPDFLDKGSEDDGWTKGLSVNKSGTIESTAGNINLILRNDSILKGMLAVNKFDNRRYILKSTPWHKLSGAEPEPVRDLDYSGIRNYMECSYGITGTQKIDDAVSIEVERRAFHPVRDYLSSLSWDGVKRVDTLLIDYLGVSDSAYSRAVIRKALCAAVARVYEPGTKYDMALILVGAQGTYKSTFLRKLGRQWFSDSFVTVQGKEAYEQLQGAWIIEMSELSALKRSESEQVKQFMSKCEDQFRPAYGRTVEVFPRQCVFFGTTNDFTFLKDPTGNRRFNPVDVFLPRATKSVRDDMDAEVDQIWAEAVELYKAGEKLYFDEAVSRQAAETQEEHSASDERTGILEDFLDIPLPTDWDGRDIAQRRQFIVNRSEDPLGPAGTERREFVCVAELWCECLGNDMSTMSRYNTRDLNDFMRSLPGWAPAGVRRVGPYGKQRVYGRI